MRPTFKQSLETSNIVAFFTEMRIGDVISYEEASKILGFEIKSTTPAYQSAKNAARRDYEVIIESVRGVGFTRLDGSSMVDRAARFFNRVRKGSRREAHVQEVAIRSNLTRGEMNRATEQLSRLRILETTSVSSPKKTEDKEIQQKPDNRAMLAALLNKK